MEEINFDCEPPHEAEVGDQWYCPGCARKFQYVLMTYGDEETEIEAWFTDETEFL